LPMTADQYLGHTYTLPFSALILFTFAFQRGWLSRLLSVKPFLILGEASYSLYLIHNVALFIVSERFGIKGITGLALGFALAICFSLALWLAIERPARAMITNGRHHRREALSTIFSRHRIFPTFGGMKTAIASRSVHYRAEIDGLRAI